MRVSARTRLVATLRDKLPAEYRVVGAPDVPDLIEPSTFAVRCWQTAVDPGPALAGGLTLPLVMWVLTGRQTPGETDDTLDAALDAVLGVLHPLEWVRWSHAERGVMSNDNGVAWHGWRFDLTAYGQITED